MTFTFVQQPIITIAHWIPASRQILADAKMLGSYIDQRLRYGVLLEEEDEVLNSTGTNGELDGLVPGDGVQPPRDGRQPARHDAQGVPAGDALRLRRRRRVMSHVDWTSCCS
jgi:HK97 family phage major capsid protein